MISSLGRESGGIKFRQGAIFFRLCFILAQEQTNFAFEKLEKFQFF